MSYTEIYGFNKSGNAYCMYEISDSWQGAMWIWREMGKQYLPKLNLCSILDMQKIWNLVNDTKIDIKERICLATTFDMVLIRKEEFETVAKAIEYFIEKHQIGSGNLSEQATIIRKLAKDDNCVAVGWNQTSINAKNWLNYHGYDEKTNEEIPYNCLEENEHWWLFDDLEK